MSDSLLQRIDAVLTEKERGDPGAYFRMSANASLDAHAARSDRRDQQSNDKEDYARQKQGYTAHPTPHAAAMFAGQDLRSRAKAIRETAPEMPTHYIYRAAKAGLSPESHVDEFAKAGVPARHIAGPLWKIHMGGTHQPASFFPASAYKAPASPQDALSSYRHIPGERSLSLVRQSTSGYAAAHLMIAGHDRDDVMDHDGTFAPSRSLAAHLAKMPVEPSVADLKKAAAPHLAEVKERTRAEAEGLLSRHLPRFEEVARHPLKGLPDGYREATEEDAGHLAKWCVKSNACLARAYAGEFGDDRRPHRLALSPHGHVVGLQQRKTVVVTKSADGWGSHVHTTTLHNDYHVEHASACCDKDNRHDAGEMLKFKEAKISHMEEPDVDEYHDSPPQSWRITRPWKVRGR